MSRQADGLDGEIIDAIYAAAEDPDLWQATLGQVHAAFGIVASSLLLHDRSHVSTVAVVDGHDDASIALWIDHFATLTPWLQPEIKLELGVPLTDEHLDIGKAARDHFENGYYYNEWVRPQGIRHAIGCVLDINGSGSLTVNGWRTAASGAFTAEESVRYASMSRHLARAARLSMTFSRLRLDASVAAAGREHDRPGVLVLGSRGELRDMNVEAQRLVEAGQGLRLRLGRLQATTLGEDVALQRLIEDASRRDLVGGRVLGPTFLQRGPGLSPLRIEIMSTPPQTSPFPGLRDAVLVVVVSDPDRPTDFPNQGLRQLAVSFSLTPAEERMVGAVQGARNLREAAISVGIGYETARTHMRSVFAKTGARSQVELVRLLGRPST